MADVFAFNHASLHNIRREKAKATTDAYLENHLRTKLNPERGDQFPQGISEGDYCALLVKSVAVLYEHVFHTEFVERKSLWQLKNEIFIDSLTNL